jgi:hypothetical protein
MQADVGALLLKTGKLEAATAIFQYQAQVGAGSVRTSSPTPFSPSRSFYFALSCRPPINCQVITHKLWLVHCVRWRSRCF